MLTEKLGIHLRAVIGLYALRFLLANIDEDDLINDFGVPEDRVQEAMAETTGVLRDMIPEAEHIIQQMHRQQHLIDQALDDMAGIIAERLGEEETQRMLDDLDERMN